MKAKQTKISAAHKRRVLQVTLRPGVSQERQFADLATDGIVVNAMTAHTFLGPAQPNLSITELVDSLKEHGKRVNANDLGAAERMLTAQTISLNAIFGEMARRAALNMGEYLDASERYMRLALKAQGQCRATVETLAAIKNPPVFAKQANIANGPQQVNNGFPHASPTPARAHEENGNEQSKLLEDGRHGSTYLDTGAETAATGGHQTVEAVGAVNRPKNPSGQGEG